MDVRHDPYYPSLTSPQLNGLQILPVWQTYFNHPAGPLLGLFGSIYSIGSLAGLPFAPFIADRYGRKTSIWAGCAILFVGVAVQSAAQDFKMFVASRFFVGFGCTLAQLSSPLLLTEIAHPQHRGAVTAVYNCLWNLGAIVATWLTYGTFNIQNNWAWRIPSILQALPSLGQFCLLFWVPESPRWLIKEDRGPEALKILAKCKPDMLPSVNVSFANICLQTTPTAMRPTRPFSLNTPRLRRPFASSTSSRSRAAISTSSAPRVTVTGSSSSARSVSSRNGVATVSPHTTSPRSWTALE